ncbi:MAG: carboxypeptidase-like regulatory domain-containing protein, partial [Acidobacteria bacterium]|nr:carboxypeptidase-like regulatory domain-containing protein [Acidobacteriota bacterium]
MRRMQRILTNVVLSATLIALCFSVSMPVFSQGGFGVIAGKVTDPTGASVPNAKIRAINIETNAKNEVTSSANGDYQILQLLPGRYRLQVEAAGFKLLERPDIQVQVSDRVTLDVALEIGEITETVTV